MLQRLVATIAVLFMLGAQQAAFVHWATHLVAGPELLARADSDDANHGGASALDNVCSVCLSFAALDRAVAGGLPPFSPPDATFFLYPASAALASFHSILTRLARGPPVLL